MESATTHGQQVINIKGQGRSDKEICGHKMQFQFFFVKSKPSNSVQLWTFYAIRIHTSDGWSILSVLDLYPTM